MLRHTAPHLALNSEDYVMSGGTQRRVYPRYESEEIKILCISFPRVVVGLTTYRVYSYTLVGAPQLDSILFSFSQILQQIIDITFPVLTYHFNKNLRLTNAVNLTDINFRRNHNSNLLSFQTFGPSSDCLYIKEFYRYYLTPD